MLLLMVDLWLKNETVCYVNSKNKHKPQDKSKRISNEKNVEIFALSLDLTDRFQLVSVWMERLAMLAGYVGSLCAKN